MPFLLQLCVFLLSFYVDDIFMMNSVGNIIRWTFRSSKDALWKHCIWNSKLLNCIYNIKTK